MNDDDAKVKDEIEVSGPDREFGRRTIGTALDTMQSIDRRGDNSPALFDPVKRAANRHRVQLLDEYGSAALKALQLEHEAQLAVHQEWHERMLVRIKGALRAAEVVFFNQQLERVYADIRRSGQAVAMDISHALEEAESIPNEKARALRIKALEEMLQTHFDQTKRLRETFEASIESQM